MNTAKLSIKLVRSFGVGLTIHSPSLNGLYVEAQIACFLIAFWSRGVGVFSLGNHWRG
jgi:hypothetical protein